MTFLLQQTVIYTVPLILVALAGVFAERSGIINLALEGIMIIGAFVGAWFVRIMQEGGWNEDAAQGLLLLEHLVQGDEVVRLDGGGLVPGQLGQAVQAAGQLRQQVQVGLVKLAHYTPSPSRRIRAAIAMGSGV